MKDGKIIQSGDHLIAKLIEESGYKKFLKPQMSIQDTYNNSKNKIFI